MTEIQLSQDFAKEFAELQKRTEKGDSSPIEPPETGMVTSVQVTWQSPEEEKGQKQADMQISDYANTKTEYAGAGMGDYLGKKKRGYV